MWVAAYGPLALKLAGEVGDGFILQLADLDIAAWMIKTVRDAAADGRPRPRRRSTFCVAAPMYIGDDWEHMRDQCRWFGGMVGNHVADIVAKYGHRRRGARRRSPTTSRAAQGYDYNSTARRATTTPTSCPTRSSTGSACSAPPTSTSRSSSSCARLGVDQFAGYLQHDNKEETLRVYGETVIPALSEHVTAKA